MIASFIGVSQTLPKTAYIKLIDVWMIFTMCYPFCVVILYAVRELLQEGDPNVPVSLDQDKGGTMVRTTIKVVTSLLYQGLPLLAVIFIILFWVLGFNNIEEVEMNDSC